MADYYCKTRTNYFTVTDLEKFKQIMASCKGTDEIEIIDNEEQNENMKFGFYCDGNIQGLPERENDDEDINDFDDIDCEYNYDAFCDALQQIIPENDAVIITEIGFEKMCYLTGYCTVITRNDIKFINLDREAVKLAAIMLKNPDFTTQMEY